jgi:hypothetical protein
MSPATSRRTAAEALEKLSAFQQAHGRLPKSTATDPHEKYLANFLFTMLRRQERLGALKPAIRERAALIPGALALDTHPDQNAVLSELKSFVQKHGHAPRHSRRGVPAQEVRLRAWISNNVYADPTRKSPRLRARHEAIVSLLAIVPSYAEKDLDDRIALAEKFVRDHGYRPSGRDMSWLKDYVHGTCALEGPYGAHSRLNDIRAARLKAIIASPSLIDFRWTRNFEELRTYASTHEGCLPNSWDEPFFTWLTVQRREYRKGKLSPERESLLRSLSGVLPEVPELSQAA